MVDILAAGVVTFRRGPEVLLVHRPRYDDWSFPKGKLDPGEHRAVAAVREVAEETGLQVRLGPPLPAQHYAVARGDKTVFYWTGRVVGGDDVGGYPPNEEIDEVAWVPAERARALLTYPHDRVTLDAALALRRRTRAVVVLRHGQALARKAWAGDDAARPLAPTGERQAERLVPLLAAYGVARVVTSSSTRCARTVQPYAAAAGLPLERHPELSEEGASPAAVGAVVAELLDGDACAVLCTHRPVLPAVYDAVRLPAADRRPPLLPAEMVVLHVRRGAVVALERHDVGQD